MDGQYRVLTWFLVVLVIVTTSMVLLVVFPGFAPPWPEQNAAYFLTSIADIFRSLQWPLVALIIAIRFRDAIVGAVSRLERFEAFGQKWELQKTLTQVEEASSLLTPGEVIGPVAAASATLTAVAEAQELPSDTGEADLPFNDEEMRQWLEANPERITAAIRRVLERESAVSASEGDSVGISEFEQRVLKSAARSPRSALTQLSLAMRNIMEEIAKSSGNDDLNTEPMSPELKATELEERGVLSALAGDAIRKWHMVRGLLRSDNKTNEDMLRAVDSGLAIIAAMQASFHLPDDVYDLHRS